MPNLPTQKGPLNRGNYEQVIVDEIGSLDADASETSIEPKNLAMMKNCRKIRQSEIETRSGIYRKTYGTFASADSDWSPLAIVEYELEGVGVIVTLVRDGTSLKAHIFDPLTKTQWDLVAICAVAGTPAALPTVDAIQFATEIVITVFASDAPRTGQGVYKLIPSAAPLIDASTWSVVNLGKTRSVTPEDYSFPDSIDGCDLIVYDVVEKDKLVQDDEGYITMSYQYGLGEAEPVKMRLPIKAPNYLSTQADMYKSNLLSRSVLNPIDNDGRFPAREKRDASHVQTRAFGYRFVIVKKYTNSAGQDITYPMAPSVDMWVPDRIYAPPFVYLGTNVDLPPSDHELSYSDRIPNGAATWNLVYDFYDETPAATALTTFYAPSFVDFGNMQAYFRQYFNGFIAVESGATELPYIWTSMHYGFQPYRAFPTSFRTKRKLPFKLEVSAFELKGAPMTVFDWADFGTLGADVSEIRIYRTDHQEPDEKDAPDKSAFDPYRYGYVGSIFPDKTFTDDIALPNFGESPIDYEGYLTDQFAGKRIWIHNDQLVLGEIEVDYYLSPPSALTQCFGFDAPSGGSALTKFQPAGSPGVGDYGIFLQYLDNENHWSDLTKIEVDVSEVVTGTNVQLALVIPRGYRRDIIKVAVWRGVWDGADWDFVFTSGTGPGVLETVDVTTSAVIIDPEAAVVAGFGDEKNVDTAHDAGSLIWSKENDSFVWPQTNYLLVHQFAPIMAFGSSDGLLVVFTDRQTWTTNLDLDNFQTELRHKTIGCIAPRAVVEVDKVLLFLSHGGLYIFEGSGVRAFPARVHSIIRRYLREDISGARLTNMRRASMGWLESCRELWLHIPASTSLAVPGTLPAKTLIYKIGDRFSVIDNYEFAIAPGLTVDSVVHATDTNYGDNPVDPVIFLTRANGQLYCTYYDATDNKMVIQDNDTSGYWLGTAEGEFRLPVNKPDQKKKLDNVRLTAEAHCILKLGTGMPRTDGTVDASLGNLNANASMQAETVKGTGYLQEFLHNIKGGAIYDVYGYTPIVRFWTKPNGSDEHMFRLTSYQAEYTVGK